MSAAPRRPGRRPRVGLLAAALAVATAAALVAPAPAIADTRPRGTTPATVSTDVLPTPQIDGVVWSQAVLGGTVYVAGRFSRARPFGARKGTREVARHNMLAYDLATGALLPFAPRFNSEVRAIVAHGRTVFATGNFTAVNGRTRTRVAAVDAGSGAARPFAGSLNSQGTAIAFSGSTVAVGGSFTSASGRKRSRLAAFAAVGGALRSWHPSADRAVQALAFAPDRRSVVVGGHFGRMNGRTARGSARVDTGAGTKNLPWAVNTVVENNGPDAAVWSISGDATSVYLSGYSYRPLTKQRRLEGVVSATWGGTVRWLEDCYGDTYGSVPIGGVVYTAGHAHSCARIGSFAQSTPIRYNHALAFTKAVTRTLKHPSGGGRTDYGGRPAPTLLDWWPSFESGTYTGLHQAVWTVTGNARYVVYGGEFTKVNGVAQQGLVRFAVPSIAPNRDGPRLSGDDLAPKVRTATGGRAAVSFKADFDRDNRYLTYTVTRTQVGTATTRVRTATIGSHYYFSRPTRTWTDTDLTPGERYAYRITVADPFGNTAVGSTRTVTAR